MIAFLDMLPRILLALIAAVLACLVASGWWLLLRCKTRIDGPKEESDRASGVSEDHLATLSLISDECSDPDTRSFLGGIVDRIREEPPVFNETTPFGFIEELVDRIDDLKQLNAGKSTKDSVRINKFTDCLKDLLRSCGVELLHSESWDPSIQRALSKTKTEGIREPEITGFGSSGISRDSKLIRKQEVLLAVPLEPTT